jgi:hypothetical protein
MLDDDYRIPVLIRIEPERLINQIGARRRWVASLAR